MGNLACWYEWCQSTSLCSQSNGKVNILAVMVGTTGQVSTQYYLDIPVEADDVNVDFTVDSSCLKFDSTSSARKHYTRAHRR